MPSQLTVSPKTKPPSISLRLATPLDAPQVVHVGSSTFTTTFGWSLPPQDLATYLEDSYSIKAITSELNNPNKKFILAFEPSAPQTVLGFAQLTNGSEEPVIDTEPERFPEPVELQRFYVLTDRAGQGIGKMLIREIERMAREMGKKTLWLGVWEENLKSQAIYKSLGFENVGHHDFVMGECVQRDYVMVKYL